MKTLKLIFALGLAAALLVGCSKSDTNTTTTTNSSNTKASSSPTSTPATSNSSAKTESTASSQSGGGETYTHKEGGIQFTLPAGWKAEPNGDMMTLTTADGSLGVNIFVAPEDNFKAATDALDKELDKTIKNVKESGQPRETTVNGMQAVTQNGTGEVNGKEIQWAVDLIQAKRPVIVLSFADPGLWEKHQGEYKQLASSIKKVE